MKIDLNSVQDYLYEYARPAMEKKAITYLRKFPYLLPVFFEGERKAFYDIRAKGGTKAQGVTIIVSDEEDLVTRCTCSSKTPHLCFHKTIALVHLEKYLSPKGKRPNRASRQRNKANAEKRRQMDLNRHIKEGISPTKKTVQEPKTDRKKLKFKKRRMYLKNLDDFILFIPAIVYDRKEVDLLSNEKVIERTEGKKILYERDRERETAYGEFLMTLHPNFEKQRNRGYFHLTLNEFLGNEWFLEVFDQIREAGIEVMGLKELEKMPYSPYRGTLSLNISSGLDWLGLELKVKFGNQAADLKDVRKAILNQDRYVLLGDGTMGVLPEEWFQRLGKIFGLGKVKRNKLKLASFHFPLLEELEGLKWDQKAQEELEKKKKKLLEFERIGSIPIPDTVTATLRNYQLAGYNWMNFLDEFGWGGCLADDMGLGKTLQTLTFINRQVQQHPDLPNLVIVPTSLLFNWEDEIRKFSPSLRYHLEYGGNRLRDPGKLGKSNLILTTYGLLIREIDWLQKVEFNYIVLDESQAIKNPLSKRYKAALKLQGRNRLALSGTPIENNTYDLYAQFNFLNPGLLGNRSFFRKTYSDPIDKFGDPNAARSLRKLLTPFLLRRTKETVAKELPEKTESILYCEMEQEQREVYDAFKRDLREKLKDRIDEAGMSNSGIYIIDALLKLRQICNSPSLVNAEGEYGSNSVKLKELMRNIQQKTGDHKILVFSQFVKMLKLIQKELIKEGIGYEYLDGKTKGRQEKVENFQTNPSVRVFLISLKAGGVGLNLTAADYVFLVDPWWNPAVEAQAIDRAHRIGQTKKVFAYKMICRDSVEEKVLQLQEKKKGIADDLIRAEEKFFKSLTKKEVMELFS